MNKIILGIDIGATKTGAVLFSANDKKVIWSRIVLTDKTSKPNFLKNLFSLIDSAKAERQFSNIGVAVAAMVDVKDGKVTKAPNIRIIDGLNLASVIQSRFKVPVKAQNDANCFSIAESKIGAGKKYKNFVGVTLGSGIGCGLIINGEIYSGKGRESAGECGHMIIDKKSKKGSFEDLASGKFIMRAYGGKSGEALFSDAKRGNAQAKKVCREFGENLGLGLSNIINMMNPEAVIIGGGISLAIKPILPAVRANIKKYVMSPKAKNTPVIISKLGVPTPAIGATFLFD